MRKPDKATPELWNYGIMEATLDNKSTRQQVNETTRLLLRKTTSQQDYETTSGAVAGGASQELRIGRVGSKLKAQSLSIPFYTPLYSLYSQLTANCSHALALRCLLSLKSLRNVSGAAKRAATL